MKKYLSILFLLLFSALMFSSTNIETKATGESYVSVVTSSSHSIALTSSGSIFTWGTNNVGQLGSGNTTTSYRKINITENGDLSGLIASGDKIIFIDAEARSNLLISEQGRVFVFGEDNSGNLANGAYADQLLPDEITGTGALANLAVGDKIVTGAISYQALILVSESGRVFSAGSKNQNAYTSTSNQSLLVEITSKGSLVNLAVGDKIVKVDSTYSSNTVYRNIYLSESGRVFVNGGQYYGSLGTGTYNSTSLIYYPIEITENGELSGIIASGDKVVDIDAKQANTYFLTQNHDVYGFGLNNYSPILDKTVYGDYITLPKLMTNRFSLNSGEYITSAKVAYYGGIFLTNQNRIFSVGVNNSGELGISSTTDLVGGYGIPTDFGDFANQSITFVSITASTFHYMAVDSNNNIYGWGNTESGAMGASPYVFTTPVQQATNIDNFNLIEMSFNSNGGSSVSTIYQLGGSVVTPPTDPSKDGYTFSGWYQDIELLLPFTFDTMPYQDITLYAKWVATTNTITYDLDGGTNNTNSQTYTIEDATFDLLDVSKDGYTFVGWYTEASFTNEISQIVQGSFGDITLYAKFISMPPQITASDDLSVEASDAFTDISSYFTISDDFTTSENLVISYTISNQSGESIYTIGSTFQPDFLGNVNVLISVEDEDGHITTETFVMTVVDTTPIAFYDNSLDEPILITSMNYYYFIDAQDFYTFESSTFSTKQWENLTLYYVMDGITLEAYEVTAYLATITTSGDYDLFAYYNDGSDNVTEFIYHFNYTNFTNTKDVLPNYYIKQGDVFNINSIELHPAFENYYLTYATDLDTSILGTYNLYISANSNIDDSVVFETGYTIIVTDQDLFPPVVSTIDFNIEAGFPIEDFTLYSSLYTITDDSEYIVEFSNDINYDVPGDYTLTLTVTDAFDNVTVAYLTVTVLPFELKYIVFNEAGGSPVDQIYLYYLDTIVMPSDPTKDGYTFDGWYTTPQYTTLFNLTTMPNQNLAVYANWIPNQYTITFNSNGGSSIDPITQDYLSYVTAPSEPTYTGFTFDTWYTDDTFTQTYRFDTMPMENITLYAAWNRNLYTVYYFPNNGSSFSYINQAFDTMVMPPNDPVYEGYTFEGWYLDGELTQLYLFGAMPANSFNLYAKWSLTEYSITFDSDGGTLVSTITQSYQSNVTAPENPTKEGYTFNGWDQTIPSTMPSENLTLTATWVINQYSISFDSDGGTLVPTMTQDYLSNVTAPENPTKEGYTFNGWDQTIPATMPSENLTLTATWTLNSYTVTYDVDGNITTENVAYQTALQNIPTPTKDGYTFVSWQIDGHDVDLSTYVQSVGDITIVATFIDSTAPIVSGVINEQVYESGSEVTITYNEGTATLNGLSFNSGTLVNTPGDYELVVTDDSGNITSVLFTIESASMNVVYISGGAFLFITISALSYILFRKKVK